LIETGERDCCGKSASKGVPRRLPDRESECQNWKSTLKITNPIIFDLVYSLKTARYLAVFFFVFFNVYGKIVVILDENAKIFNTNFLDNFALPKEILTEMTN
jgi:hypothetical protein